MSKLHPRNKHQGRYDMAALVAVCPALQAHIIPNRNGEDTIDFANPESVIVLNRSLLQLQYGIESWTLPEGHLCPPIPGRADYIHHAADLLTASNFGQIPTGPAIKVLDIGTGASCIYPIIGSQEYDWSFVGSDIDEKSIEAGEITRSENAVLAERLELRHQPTKKHMYKGIVNEEERFHLTMCNPPFHSSEEEAKEGTMRKRKNLAVDVSKPLLNFGGKSNELWYPGGERKFVGELIFQSKIFGENCLWFSTLVSKQNYLKSFYEILEKVNALEVRTIPMGQGNKVSRVLAWTFHTPKMQQDWFQNEMKIEKKDEKIENIEE